MATRRTKKTWLGWLIGVGVVALLGAWVAQSWLNQPAPATEVTMTTKTLDVRPQIIETSDAYSRYVQGLSTGSVGKVSEANIFYAKNVDWNAETVAAISYTVLDAATVTSAGIEQVEGKESYVVDVLMPSDCGGASPQSSSLHVAFIKQTSKDANRPVILRTTPNTAECPNFPQ